MRYINLHFTYLLTYLLTYFIQKVMDCMHQTVKNLPRNGA